MKSASPTHAAESGKRRLLVDARTNRVPSSVALLNQCQYAERMIHRLLAAWGRRMNDWDGKAALHRHVWDQAEIVRRLRERIRQFPGGKPDAPVAQPFDDLAVTAIHAPSFEDAIDGIYKVILYDLVGAYISFVQRSHPVHDAPSLALFHEINTIKAQHFTWYRSYRKLNPHKTNPAYLCRLRAAIGGVEGFQEVLPARDSGAVIPCPSSAKFSLPKVSSRPQGWAPAYNIFPYLSIDFAENVETRRLFWAMAYLQEMNLPDDQLSWLYYGDYMPWEWHYDVSRHLWDESRHGCSGRSRLADWGISIGDVGFFANSSQHFNRPLPPHARLQDTMIQPYIDEAEMDFDLPMTPLDPASLYETVWRIGMVAESGHFTVKNEGYDDFREAKDFESAEMMLFDIIDETLHVQYAHRWLPLLAEHAGIDNSNYKQRALAERKRLQEGEYKFIEQAKELPRTMDFAPYRHYQGLLAKVREACPIPDTQNFPRRKVKPM